MQGPATGAGGAGPAAPPPTFFQQVGDVRLVPVPHPDLPLVCQEGLLLGVVDQRVEEEVLESSAGRGCHARRRGHAGSPQPPQARQRRGCSLVTEAFNSSETLKTSGNKADRLWARPRRRRQGSHAVVTGDTHTAAAWQDVPGLAPGAGCPQPVGTFLGPQEVAQSQPGPLLESKPATQGFPWGLPVSRRVYLAPRPRCAPDSTVAVPPQPSAPGGSGQGLPPHQGLGLRGIGPVGCSCAPVLPAPGLGHPPLLGGTPFARRVKQNSRRRPPCTLEAHAGASAGPMHLQRLLTAATALLGRLPPGGPFPTAGHTSAPQGKLPGATARLCPPPFQATPGLPQAGAPGGPGCPGSSSAPTPGCRLAVLQLLSQASGRPHTRPPSLDHRAAGTGCHLRSQSTPPPPLAPRGPGRAWPCLGRVPATGDDTPAGTAGIRGQVPWEPVARVPLAVP